MQATREQIEQLELAHKQQLRDLIVVYTILHGTKATTSTQINARGAYAQMLLGLTYNWLSRNLDFEHNAGIPKSIFTLPGIVSSFMDKERFETKIKPAAAYYIYAQHTPDNTQKIGFLPLLIWAVIAIVAYFTVAKVVDGQTATADDKVKLVDATNAFCKANNLTPEQCATMLAQQTAAENNSPGFFDSIKTILLWGVGGFVAFKFILPEIQKQTNKKQLSNG